MVLCDYLPGSLCLFAWYFVNICLVLDNAHWTALTIFVMLLYFCICLQRKSSPLTTAGISTAIQQTMVHRGWASSRFPGTWGGSRILWRRSRILWGGSRILWRLARISAVGGTSGGRRNLFNSCRRDSPWTLRRILFEKICFSQLLRNPSDLSNEADRRLSSVDRAFHHNHLGCGEEWVKRIIQIHPLW